MHIEQSAWGREQSAKRIVHMVMAEIPRNGLFDKNLVTVYIDYPKNM